jgi:hypothetical protein
MGKFIDLTSKKINNWNVLHRVFIKKNYTHWLCICICGNKANVNSSHLLGNKSTQCKTCHNKKAVKMRPKKHGACTGSETKEYKIWSRMKTRCLNKNSDAYHNYGGRNINISKNWLKFENFIKDMGKCPEKMSLERINVNKGYCKSNCKWASSYDQSRNKRTNIYLRAHNKKMVITDWAKLYNIPFTSFRRLIDKKGWPLPSPPEDKS